MGDAQKTRLAWFDRRGEMVEPFGDGVPGLFSLKLSNDESRVAYELEREIWVLEFERNTETRLSIESANSNPVWSPDDEWIAFYSNREPAGVYRKRSSGIGDVELLYEDVSLELTFPWVWSPDGKSIICATGRGDTSFDITRLDLASKKHENLVRTNFLEIQPDLSSDGNWLAMTSDESGRPEVYVYQLASPGGRWQASTSGGSQPTWSSDGRTLYYLAEGSVLMRVSIEIGDAVRIGAPEKVMDVDTYQGPGRKYAVTADGSKVLWNTLVGGTSQGAPLSVVQNWTALLEAE